MEKQERKFTLAEASTKVGQMGEVRFDQALLKVLGVKPGDFLVFTISPEGAVTVTGEKKTAQTIPQSEVIQPALFNAGQPIPRPPRQRRRTR